MGRCGCTQPANASMSSGLANCLAITGNGSVATPYVVTPRISVVDGQTLSCAADGLYAGQAAASTYTPALTASTTNPGLGGSPTQQGFYAFDGEWVEGDVYIVFGSAPSAGSGTYAVGLPVVVGARFRIAGAGVVYDASANSLWTVAVLAVATTATAQLQYTGAAGAWVVTNAAPFTWAVSDFMRVGYRYQT